MLTKRVDGLRRNLLVASMNDDERARLNPFFQRVHLSHKQLLAAHREPIEYLYFPIDAVTSTLMELAEGETVEVGLMGDEGVVGLSVLYGERNSNATVIAQIPGEAERIAVDVFQREVVNHGGPFYRLLLRYSNIFMEMIAQGAACNASHSVEQRCARWILMAHDRVMRDDFPLTHEYLSLMLGVRRASVSGVASALRMAGALDYDRGHVRVVDRNKLAMAACACYPALVEMASRIVNRTA